MNPILMNHRHTLDIFERMYKGEMVITPNNRLSTHLLQTYDHLYRGQQSAPLAKPRCFSYENWLHYLFKQITYRFPLLVHPLLLSTLQQRYLWQMILRQHQETSVSLGLLDVIQDAWRRCVFWQIQPDDPVLQQTAHTRRFQRWYHSFQQNLNKNQATTIELLPEYLIKTECSLEPTSMIWTCFDEFTPIQTCLQQNLQAQGSHQFIDDYQENSVEAYRFSAKNQQEEFQQAVVWIRKRLAHGDHHIAVIVPDLQQQIQIVENTFSQHFSADLYTISYGRPLVNYPIINTALHFLSLDLQTVDAQQVRLLLQTPFIAGGENEFAIRSQILQDNGLMKALRLPWQDFLNHIRVHTPDLYQCLSNLKPYARSDRPFAWVTQFKERLRCLGFPGDMPIDSTTYQCLNRFYLLLDDVMSMNTLISAISVDEAILILRELSSTTLFQIQKPPTPVTVLGLLEASGCRFDSIWFMGLTDQCLPQKTKFSPFLPIHLQKSIRMPHTDSHREFQRARLVLNRLEYASDSIVYSFPLTLGDEPCSPSNLIHHYPHYLPQPIPIKDMTSDLQIYSETYHHPLRNGERLSGGTALLANQAKCPFQAFATHRFKIKPSLVSTDGLDLNERGQILHHIMEIIWTNLTCQANLLQLDGNSLTVFVQESVQIALRNFQASRPAALSELSLDIEYERLQDLAHACLEWEKQRAPFQIESLEQSYAITLAGLAIRMRVDRLDKNLSQPGKTVIDYKTSLPNTKPWLEERPESPQLLLYALLDHEINTLMFMQLKTGQMTLKGLSANPHEDPGIQVLKENESWTSYQQFWEQQLSQLAIEVQEGFCEPQPKRMSICQTCPVQNLCRAN